MSDLYRDFIDQKADQIINSLGGTITPAVPNELYRDFLDRKFDDVINAISGFNPIKSFSYKGTNSNPANIQFPEKPNLVLGIFASDTQARFEVAPFRVDMPGFMSVYIQPNVSTTPTTRSTECSYDDNTNILTVNGQYPTYAMNILDIEYTVYYI